MTIDILEEIKRGHVMKHCLKAQVHRRWGVMENKVKVILDITNFLNLYPRLCLEKGREKGREEEEK